jgi:hypothetical protein
VAGKAPVRRSRFIVVTGTGKSINRAVEAKASAVAIRSSIGEMGLARSRANPGMLRLRGGYRYIVPGPMALTVGKSIVEAAIAGRDWLSPSVLEPKPTGPPRRRPGASLR